MKAILIQPEFKKITLIELEDTSYDAICSLLKADRVQTSNSVFDNNDLLIKNDDEIFNKTSKPYTSVEIKGRDCTYRFISNLLVIGQDQENGGLSDVKTTINTLSRKIEFKCF